MKYFFILGTNPVLSAAEIIALLDGRYYTIIGTHKQALIVEAMAGHDLNVGDMMARLGGTVKIGTVLTEGLAVDEETVTDFVFRNLVGRSPTSKMNFGFSVYSLEMESPSRHASVVYGKLKNVGMEVKKKLTEAGIGARWVKAQQGVSLTSVVVAKNRMTDENGAELVILTKGDQCSIGVTEIVQPFEEFSKTDFGRPDRDTYQGMLPPKLARIMINLIHVSREVRDTHLLDPFCGSGTVLSEAMRIGFTHLYGSDKNPQAITATRTNLEWMGKHWLKAAPENSVHVQEADAREIGNILLPGVIDAVVTEPYLGPPRRGRETRGDLQKTLGELTKLYRDALASWRKCLKPGAPLVIAFPLYIFGLEKHGINVKEFESLGFKPEPLLPNTILSRLGTNETKNHGLLYGRNDQHVWREIVRLRYQP